MSDYVNLFDVDGDPVSTVAGNLQEKFGAPPFSVFDARQGWWQARKAAWISIGIQSELGRGENFLRFSDTGLEPDPKKCAAANRTSTFVDQDRLSAFQRGMNSKKRSEVYGAPASSRMSNGKARASTSESGRPADLAGSFKSAERPALPGRKTSGNPESSAWLSGRKRNAAPGGSAHPLARAKRAAEEGRVATGIAGQLKVSADSTLAGSGTSIFDPVLCELFYRWFVPKGGVILDPFAGGSVRGIVAAKLGYDYIGVDLRPEQLDANRAQAQLVCRKPQPHWIAGNSCNLDTMVDANSVDAIWSCPPYFNLEQYSEDPEDLSNMTYDEFLAAYETIIEKAGVALQDNRFVGWVIGEVRNEKGFCRGLVSDTIYLFEKHGMHLYNDAILLTAVGSLSIRVGRQFKAGRKLGKTHQYVLIFCKGDPSKAVGGIVGLEEE